MKEFLAQYLLNLWIYGSQAMILYFAGRKLVVLYAAKQIEKRFTRQGNVSRALGLDDIRNERSA